VDDVFEKATRVAMVQRGEGEAKPRAPKGGVEEKEEKGGCGCVLC